MNNRIPNCSIDIHASRIVSIDCDVHDDTPHTSCVKYEYLSDYIAVVAC